MKKKYLIIIALIIWIFSPAFFCQEESKVLAKIGSDVITVEEFKDRFDFMPHLNYSNNNIDSVKKEFLFSLIAEKLWAQAADEMGLDTIETVKYSLKTLQNLFIKDELYKQEVESKIIITNNELAKELVRVNRILVVDIISSSDSMLIQKFYDASLNNSHADSLINALGLTKIQYQIKYGFLQSENVEDVLYNLKLNQVSIPIKSNEQWLVFKLLDDEHDKSIRQGSDYAKNLVIRKLKEQKSQLLGRKFLDELLGGKKITADKKLFDLIAETLFQTLKKNYANPDSLKNIELSESDILNTQKKIDSSKLKNSFIHIESDHITINDFLYYLVYQKINFSKLSLQDIKQTLNLAAKQFIEDLVIAEEGRKRGLENNYNVRQDLQLWKNYYMAEILMNSYADSIRITDIDVENILRSDKNLSNDKLQVNIVEILTDNLDDIENIFAKINSGKSFEDLVPIYNKREWTKQSNGEWGFFNSNDGGEIGRIAAKMEVGEIYGPVKAPEGYSIFKLIAKRTENVNPKNSNNGKNEKFIRIKLALKRMDDLIIEKTISLANKQKISIDEQLLKNIETSGLNTFTYRLIGFGGKIAAFPVTIPMFKWYYEFTNQKEIP